jgi:hypothetical protein
MGLTNTRALWEGVRMSKKQQEKEVKALKELEKRRKKAGFKIVAVKVK